MERTALRDAFIPGWPHDRREGLRKRCQHNGLTPQPQALDEEELGDEEEGGQLPFGGLGEQAEKGWKGLQSVVQRGWSGATDAAQRVATNTQKGFDNVGRTWSSML